MGVRANSEVAGRFAAALLLLGMLSWPIALLPPPFSGHSYYLYFPARVLLLAIAVILLARARFSLPRWLLAALAIFAIGLLPQFSHTRWDAGAIAGTLAYAVLPLAVAVCAAVARPARLARWLAALWLLEVAYAALNAHYGGETIGTTGNRNWLAILLLALTPWACMILRQRFGNLLGLIVVLAPTAWVLKRCESRAAWLALVVYFALMLVLRARGTRRLALIATIAALALAWLPSVKQIAARDVRLPTWRAAIQMALDEPLRGTGLGNYALACVPYQLASGYHESHDAADVTEHPHNEFLHLAAAAGLPVAFAWLALLLPLLRTPQQAPGWLRAAQCSGLLLLVHGMLDKPLVQAPTDVLFLAMLGLCWAPLLRVKMLKTTPPEHLRVPFLAGATALLLLALAESARTLVVSAHRRAAIVLRHDYGDDAGALRAYQSMLSIDGNNLGALYGASSLLVNRLQDPEKALDYLHAAREIAPNYAHLNGLTGRAFGALGLHTDALPYLRRECELYPMQVRPLQELWLAQALAKDADLADTQQALRKLYRKRAAMWSRDQTDTLISEWELLIEKDAESAIDQANQICHLENKPSKNQANLRFVDPLIDAAAIDVQMPPARIHGGFDRSDVAYWRLRNAQPITALKRYLEHDAGRVEEWLLSGLKSCRPIAHRRTGELLTLLLDGRYWRIDAQRQLLALDAPPADFAKSAIVLLAPNATLLRNQMLGHLAGAPAMDWFPSDVLAEFDPENFQFLEP
jgi:O-antigen ligase